MADRAEHSKLRLARRGRCSLGVALASFVAVQLLWSLAMDRCDTALRDPLWGRKLALLRSRVAAEPERPLVVILGSSRAALGLRTEALPELEPGDDGTPPIVFNLGIMGAGPVHELMYLKRLLSEGIRPDWILLEIHPLLLHEDPGFGELAVLNVDRLDWTDLGVFGRYVYEPAKLYRRWARSRLLPCLSHRVLFQMQFAPRWLEPAYRNDYVTMTRLDSSGWTPHFRDAVNSTEYRQCLELSVTAYEPAFNQYRITELPDRAVREMLEICRRERIAAGLFLMPEASEFQSAYTADARETLDEYLATLSREHGVPVFDATNGAADADFADGHHLLPPGAAAFAPTFDRDVLRPFLARALSRHDLFADDASTASEVASRSPLDYETTLRR